MTTQTAQRGQEPQAAGQPATAQRITADDLAQRLDAWHERFRSDRHGDDTLRQAIAEYGDLADPTFEHDGFIDQHEVTDSLFGDLRPSEARRLYELMEAARDRAMERARRLILEEIAEAAEAFAREYPAIPRTPIAPTRRGVAPAP